MPTVVTWWNVPEVVAWAVAVWGLAHAVFRSLPGMLTIAWLDQWGVEQARNRLRWEVASGWLWTAEAYRKKQPELSGKKLDEAQIHVRRRELMRIAWPARFSRVLRYLLTCEFCQHAEMALVLLLCTQGGWGSVPAAFGYATLATFGVGWAAQRAVQAGAKPCSGPGCRK